MPSPDAGLSEALSALASESRLALLRQLRTPRTLTEIELKPEAAGEEARNVARQTVRKHLDRLLASGMVTHREAVRHHGRPTMEYVVNHRALFALSEELRVLARLRPQGPVESPTVSAAPAHGQAPTGPCLVTVKGLDEGEVHALVPPGPTGGWIVGRRRGASVQLDYDATVSSENSVVEWDGEAYWVRDLPDSRNGTTVNFVPLPKGGRARLRMGDLVGVGHVVLLFRT